MRAIATKTADDGVRADQFRAPVKVWLRPAAWRTLERLAQVNNTTIGELLANLADHALDPAKHTRDGVRRWKRTTPEQVRDLRALRIGGASIREAAEAVGLGYGTAHRILTTTQPGDSQ